METRVSQKYLATAPFYTLLLVLSVVVCNFTPKRGTWSKSGRVLDISKSDGEEEVGVFFMGIVKRGSFLPRHFGTAKVREWEGKGVRGGKGNE